MQLSGVNLNLGRRKCSPLAFKCTGVPMMSCLSPFRAYALNNRGRGKQRRAAAAPLRSFPQLPGGPGRGDGDALLAKLKRDNKGNPRLCVALAAVLRALSRMLLGTRADVSVTARSNRSLLSGRITTLSVETGAMEGLLLSSRGGSLRGTQLDLGVRPLLILLYLPVVLLGFIDVFSMTLITVAAYLAVPPASPSSSLDYSLSLSEQDLNSSFAIRSLLGMALAALMRNSLLISALSAAAVDMGGKTAQSGWLKQVADASEYRLESSSLDISKGGFFSGGGKAGRGRLVMEASAVLPAEPGQPSNGNFKFKLRTSIQPQPAGSMTQTLDGPLVSQSNLCIFVDPQIEVTPAWPLPSFWLPVGSGVGIDLGTAISISAFNFIAPSQDGTGGLNVAGQLRLGL